MLHMGGWEKHMDSSLDPDLFLPAMLHLHKLQQTLVTRKAIQKMGKSVMERKQLEEQDNFHNKKGISVPKHGHFCLEPLPNKSNSEPHAAQLLKAEMEK